MKMVNDQMEMNNKRILILFYRISKYITYLILKKRKHAFRIKDFVKWYGSFNKVKFIIGRYLVNI